ncbi:putative amino acid permease [Cryphonectria parasitica EP155]|uniref:Amino acid permease n=1 Tax=Cryphonectria parasitica (strain ATCC 38755 / EP155) TaxID=660469 RepID=A0A9P5CQL3_CRYP1|nr:putative amino acid permease [Cryphonectria parasitica EP155]KAF3766562.1 putative amino acid permease [Cryphonectria parasitica EP155]
MLFLLVLGTQDDAGGLILDVLFLQSRQGLAQRHIQMIALAGAIGTGLFLGSGGAIEVGGPLGALLGYFLVGILVVGVVMSIAEMSTLVPLSGAIIRHAEYFFDPALSFAQGWNSVYNYLVSIPAELTAAAVIVSYWDATTTAAAWIILFGGLLVIANLLFVRVYGEMEFVFATLKIMLIVGLNIMAIVIVSGGGPDHQAIGFKYWRNPGPFTQYLGIGGSLGQFLGFWKTFGNAVYSYSGVENISMAASETQNPRRNIPIAAKRIFWRVAIFYVLSIFFVGMLVPSDDDQLLNAEAGTAAASPFVIAATRAGIKVVPSIINFVVLTSAWSAGNSYILANSRILYGMAQENHAPKIFLRTNRMGIPYVGVSFTSIFICLGFMSLSSSASVAFTWLQDLVSVGALVTWSVICAVYLRFYYGMKAQGISRDELPWKAPFQPYTAWFSLCFFILLLLTGGFTTFIKGDWSTETFISSYIDIPIFFALYFGYKIVKKTKIVPLHEIPIRRFIDLANANPEPPVPPKQGWRKLNILWE